jgi:hypothetical protein
MIMRAGTERFVGDVLVFQSGRWYTEQGQRMAAVRCTNGAIAFYDADRMIQGLIMPDLVETLDLKLTEQEVMWAYDRPDTTKYWYRTSELDQEDWQFLKEAALTAPVPTR